MKKMEDDIIVHPSRGVREKSVPMRGLFLVNPTEARTAIQTLLDRGGDQRFLFHSGLVVSPDDDFFVAGPAVGAPMAAMILEKLIALGARCVVMAGWCGAVDPALNVGDTVLGGIAHPGEGTSRYYGRDDVFQPTSRLLEELRDSFNLTTPVPVWSTDAPYRESRKMLMALAKRYNVSAVDMEYSALCAVAAFRGVDFASLFLVSDELWKQDWHPGFNGKVFKRKSKAQIKLLMKLIPHLSSFKEA
ncbi:MAG: nucleoside phosphorylase [Desulfocapsa sp.]|nr:nucleoside phosphorylase [Desulfocapsa sp.]